MHERDAAYDMRSLRPIAAEGKGKDSFAYFRKVALERIAGIACTQRHGGFCEKSVGTCVRGVSV